MGGRHRAGVPWQRRAATGPGWTIAEVSVETTGQGITQAHEAVAGQPSEPIAGRSWWRFFRHYLEMVAAMLVGMFVLGGVLRAVLAGLGVEYSMASHPELMLAEMALTMTVAMAAWMRYRGHGWAATLEMSAAMLVPGLAMVPLVWRDVLDGGMAMMLEHLVMFPLMLAVMLRRRDEYAVAHGRRREAVPEAGPA